MRAPRLACGIAAALLPAALTGCAGVQSALDPAGPNAREIAALWWAMAAGAAVIFALVLGLLLYAVLAAPHGRARVHPMTLIVGGGVVLPVVALSILVPFNVNVSAGATAASAPDTLTVHVRGRQWWWDVEYEGGARGVSFRTANEIYLPVGEPVELILTSSDVIHSLWFPRLAGKLDMIPGQTNRLVIEADEQGVFRGQCAEFCGIGHTKMALYAVAVPPDEFADWADRQREPAPQPGTEQTRAGADLFHASGCPLCHTVRGSLAWGRFGPDLTHVGGRLTVGAGLVDNTADNLAAWIAHNDALKRGNRMPDYSELSRESRAAIAAYLESLE